MKRLLLIFLAIMALTSNVISQNVESNQGSKLNDPKMDWWREAKFGMFIHWGLYAVPAGKWGEKTTYGEWIMHNAKIPVAEYALLATKFNPVKFNADEWVKLAKDAGQKYIVITTKHHDGFAMFGSKASTFNIVDATPYKRDIIKELADACRKQNMKLGFYYSQAQDWHHRGGAISGGKEWDEAHVGDMNKYIDSIAVPQVKEILENYGDVAVLWWDTPTGMTKEMSQKLADIAAKYPNLITNNRLGAGMGGDLETPEQFIPATGFPGRNWEVCMTMNGNWGYNAHDDRWKSTEDLLRKLIDIASKGGNFLLNVGPNAEGIIPEVCQQNLREVGAWLQTNGEAVYGTTASPFPFLSWGRATRKSQTIYLHVFDWPKNGKLIVPIGNKITKAYLLADAKTMLKVKAGKGNSNIQLPAYSPDKMAAIVAIQIAGEPQVQPIPSCGKKVTASTSEDEAKLKTITDGSPNAGWKAAKGEKSAVLEIDLEVPVAIQTLALAEPWHPWNGVNQKFELQYLEETVWKTIVKGQTDGSGLTKNFPAVKAQKFRLMLENKNFPPAVNELILFRAE
jgi:alpha-L-fucosidase